MSYTSIMNTLHNIMKFIINFLPGPIQSHAVLAHLQAGNSYTASICRFTGTVENLIVKIHFNRFRCLRHICTYGHTGDSVTGFPPRSRTFSTEYCATFPEPEIATVFPSKLSSLVFNISLAK